MTSQLDQAVRFAPQAKSCPATRHGAQEMNRRITGKCLALWLCVSLATISPVRAQQSSAAERVLDFIEAYNAHDVDKMLTMVSADIRWMNVDGIRIRLQAAGREALGTGMTSYFAGLPSARAEVRDIRQLDDFVTVVEAAIWDDNGRSQAQCAVSVYQLTAGLIANVWYYPARECPVASD